jgi:nucleoid-associated protein YgaU
VLAVGAAAALLFRREAPPVASADPPAREEGLILRGQRSEATRPVATPATPAPPEIKSQVKSSSPAGAQPAHDEPPPLAPRYHQESLTAAKQIPGRGASGGETPVARRERTHKVVDGDTLVRLAERYLGSGNRYREILEANRDVLPNPDILPIGVVLRIPPREPDHSGTQSPDPSQRLVPIPPGALRRE